MADASEVADAVEAALNLAVDAAALAVVGVIQSILSSAVGIIATAFNIIETLTFPFVGEIPVLTDARERLAEISDGLDVEINDVQREGILNAIADVSAAADFPLDRSEPFSADSLTFAVNHKLGTAFQDVTDPDSIKEYFENRAADEVNQILGVAAFENGEDLKNPERWAEAIAAMLADALDGAVDRAVGDEIRAGAAFLQGYACPPANVVLELLCKTQHCNPCMGEDAETECHDKRDKAKRNRSKYDKQCIRRKR